MSSQVQNTVLRSEASRFWDELSQRVDALIQAWESMEGPPLDEFLPEGPPALRRMVLTELIKIDLEYRWQRGLGKTLDDYLLDFPELDNAGIPCDLIYEEFHVRKQNGDEVEPEEYCLRFPDQAPELRRLLGLEAVNVTTLMVERSKAEEIQVGDKLDDFDLLTRLGKGAFATVFLARQRSMQRLVALKISSDRGNEPQTMAQLDHPHIVRVYDQRLLPERKLRLLYMQHIPGGTLEAVIDWMRAAPPEQRSGRTLLEAVDQALVRRGESPPNDSRWRDRLKSAPWGEVVCRLGARLASALGYAHERGILHRDVKPANVLLAADCTPKLADFNISFCSKIDGATPAAYFGGSLAYMSPEQLEACDPSTSREANELDGRSDVFSLGVMLWELLCGERPFIDEPLTGNWSQTLGRMTAHRRSGVPEVKLQALPGNLPAGLREVLLQCLASRPEDRFATGAELARHLELCLEERTQRLVRPQPDGLLQRLRKHPTPLLLAAGILPNGVMSALNIAYNYDAIVKYLSGPAQELFSTLR